MEELYTDQYDVRIMEKSPHLRAKSFPQLLPFIGKYWEESKLKILFLGESHYIPSNELNSNEKYINSWYDQSSEKFGPNHSNRINTRYVITRADSHNTSKAITNKEETIKPLSIYLNIKKELKSIRKDLFASQEHIFPFLAMYNYFQRPAFEEGKSIINNEKDNKVAFETLQSVVEIIKPKLIIFASRKAFAAFKTSNRNKAIIDSNIVKNIPHPGSAWWNRKASIYGDKTGKEHFVNIIQSF